MYYNSPSTENQNAERIRYATPRADIYSNAEGTHVVLDLPGVAQQDLEITVEDQLLTIVGHRKNDVSTTEEPAHQEIQPFDYRREFSLASSIDTTRIQAELREGVLSLQLPFAEKVKPRRIAVT